MAASITVLLKTDSCEIFEVDILNKRFVLCRMLKEVHLWLLESVAPLPNYDMAISWFLQLEGDKFVPWLWEVVS